MDTQKCEDIYKKVIESSEDSIFVLDKDLKYVFVNKKLADNLGKPLEYFVGRSLFEFFPEIISENLSKNIQSVFNTNKVLRLEEKITIKNGDTYNSSILSPIMDIEGQIVAVAGIVRDVTKEKETQDALSMKIDELSKLNTLTVNRELKMVELKNEINELKKHCS